MPPAALRYNRRRSVPRCCRGRFRATAARRPPASAARRAWDAPWPSSRDLPGGAVLGILEHDAHGGEFVADAVGFFEILCLARGVARFDQVRRILFSSILPIDVRRGMLSMQLSEHSLDQQPQSNAQLASQSSASSDRALRAFGRLCSAQLVKCGNRLRRIKIVDDSASSAVGAQIARLRSSCSTAHTSRSRVLLRLRRSPDNRSNRLVAGNGFAAW